ncbi:hypothetical protein [Vulgatibacter sp.]|uniref:hypothetical protein n=1 Tax=Vulgatibacter sp. TaxID=1971226 RepID=UPI0035626463
MRQLLVIAGLIICATVATGAFLASTGVSNVVGSGQAFAEKTAVSTLRTLHWAQGNLRRGAFIDTDRDGIAEFGTMEQLAATAPLPSGQVVPATLVPLAGNTIEGGILEAHGYCFRYDLPEGADGRERRFVAYAWPRLAAAGNKVFCIDQDEDILQSGNEAGWIGCEQGPPPGTCPEAEEADRPGATWVRWKGKRSQLKVGAID